MRKGGGSSGINGTPNFRVLSWGFTFENFHKKGLVTSLYLCCPDAVVKYKPCRSVSFKSHNPETFMSSAVNVTVHAIHKLLKKYLALLSSWMSLGYGT